MAESFRRKKKPQSYNDSQKDSNGLLPKQRLFVEHMLEGFDVNPGVAAEKAGYSFSSGATLVKLPEIQKAIKKRRDELTEELIAPIRVDQESVVSEMAKLAFSNPHDYCDEDEDGVWVPKKKSDLSRESAAAIKKLIFGTCPITKQRVLQSVEFHDKLGALRDLMKHLGLFEKDNQQKQPNFNIDNVIECLPLTEEGKNEVRKKLFKDLEQEEKTYIN